MILSAKKACFCQNDDLMNGDILQVLTPLKQEPSSGLSSPMTLSAADLTSSGRKRSDIDFESFSDPKRRKTEKGGKGLRHFSMKVSHACYCPFSPFPKEGYRNCRGR